MGFVDGVAVGEAPDIFIEGGEFFLDEEEGLCVCDRGRYFESVADDGFILEEREEFGLGIRGNFLRVEVIEGAAEGVAFIEDAFPGESGLEGFEEEEFEEFGVVMDWAAPFCVVVGDVEWVVEIAPGASLRLRRGI